MSTWAQLYFSSKKQKKEDKKKENQYYLHHLSWAFEEKSLIKTFNEKIFSILITAFCRSY